MAIELRSRRWLAGDTLSGFLHRVSLPTVDRPDVPTPIIGICSAWSELVHCNLHLRGLVAAVKRGVVEGGGAPVEFPTMSLGENLMKPTAMLYRNLMAMEVEETIRSNPLDGVVLIGACDKTVPAQLMGAASVDLPCISLTGGPAEPVVYRGERLGSGTDLWKYADDRRAGRMSDSEWAELEEAATTSAGHCTELGTASTMAALVEALGMSLPGAAAAPALHPSRTAIAEATGRRAVELVHEGQRPSAILTPEAFDNAITTLVALAGSTNAVVHLIALAGRVGVDLPLARFDEIAARTPRLANLRPGGAHLFEDFFQAGGVPTLLRELRPLLHTRAETVAGAPLEQSLVDAAVADGEVVARRDDPVGPAGGLAVVSGSLAPDGAVIKVAAASPDLLRHRGPAVVFDGLEDMLSRLDDPALDVHADSVLLLRNAGPRGGPGMPEWGMVPIPSKLLREGVTDMVRVSDARMSGTGFGTVALHAAPEAAVGGPLALVQNGDPVVLDVPGRRLDLDVPDRELSRRRARWCPPRPASSRGFVALYLEHVEQADRGCDFDFLRALPGEDPEREPAGLFTGWRVG